LSPETEGSPRFVPEELGTVLADEVCGDDDDDRTISAGVNTDLTNAAGSVVVGADRRPGTTPASVLGGGASVGWGRGLGSCVWDGEGRGLGGGVAVGVGVSDGVGVWLGLGSPLGVGVGVGLGDS